MIYLTYGNVFVSVLLNSAHPLLSPLCPKVCSLFLHLHCWKGPFLTTKVCTGLWGLSNSRGQQRGWWELNSAGIFSGAWLWAQDETLADSLRRKQKWRTTMPAWLPKAPRGNDTPTSRVNLLHDGFASLTGRISVREGLPCPPPPGSLWDEWQ